MPVTTIAFLAAAIASVLTSLAACVIVLREPGLRFKPIWIPFCFVGMGGGALVWAAPEQVYWFFGIALPTVSYSAVPGGWEPQYLRVFFPLGALVVLLRVWRWRGKRAKSKLVGFSVG